MKIEWNGSLSGKVVAAYRKWTDELCLLDSIKIPRYTFSKLEKIKNLQLRGFADASEDAYVAVVYFHAEDFNSNCLRNG